ncbi:hypothetical protein AHAS_Ahas11G0138500 [Arachis hypogaea]
MSHIWRKHDEKAQISSTTCRHKKKQIFEKWLSEKWIGMEFAKRQVPGFTQIPTSCGLKCCCK